MGGSTSYNKVIIDGETGEILIFDPLFALAVLNFVKTGGFKAYVILTRFLVRDLSRLHGTHSEKDRVIARLKKFLWILKNMEIDHATIDPETNEAAYLPYTISLYRFYLPHTATLRSAIEGMEYFKGETHRLRNRIHELFYPHLRSALDGFLSKTIEFHVGSVSKRRIRCHIFYTESRDKVYINCAMTIPVKDGERSILLSQDKVEEILRKKIERIKRRERRRPCLRYDFYEALLLGEFLKSLEKTDKV